MKPTKLALAEHTVVTYYHVPEFETSFEDVLEPDYWAHVAPSLRQGHRIELLSADGSWWAMLLVRAAGKHEAIVQELQHVELGKSVQPEIESAAFEVKWRGPSRKFGVIRVSDGAVVKEDIQTKEGAAKWLSNYVQNLAA